MAPIPSVPRAAFSSEPGDARTSETRKDGDMTIDYRLLPDEDDDPDEDFDDDDLDDDEFDEDDEDDEDDEEEEDEGYQLA
jgi:hypothetical protein